MYVLFAIRGTHAVTEDHESLTKAVSAIDHLVTNGYTVTIAGNVTREPADTTDTTAAEHPLVNHIIEVINGRHKGKRGRISGIHPSKYNAGEFYATVHPTDGDRFFADVNACRAIDQSAPAHWSAGVDTSPKPPAPSVRRPVARKLNGSVPW